MSVSGISCMHVSNAAKVKSLCIIAKYVGRIFFVLFLTIVTMSINGVFVWQFTETHGDFVRCRSLNASIRNNRTNEFICLKNKEILQNTSTACIGVLIVCFLFMIIVNEYFWKILKELATKVENKKQANANKPKPKPTKATSTTNNSNTNTAAGTSKQEKVTEVKRENPIKQTKPGTSGNTPDTNVSASTVFAQLEDLNGENRNQNIHGVSGTSLDLLERQNRILLEQNQLLMQQLVHATASQQTNIQRSPFFNNFMVGNRVFPSAPQTGILPHKEEGSSMRQERHNPPTLSIVEEINNQQPTSYDAESNRQQPTSYDAESNRQQPTSYDAESNRQQPSSHDKNMDNPQPSTHDENTNNPQPPSYNENMDNPQPPSYDDLFSVTEKSTLK